MLFKKLFHIIKFHIILQKQYWLLTQ